jgi:phosphate transport system substrate-binding protein
MGTPDYCAPEQIRGRQVDGRTDQYALACVAFALLTGAPPFPRSEAVATLFAQLNDPIPDAASTRPGLSPALNPVLARALAKDPQDRFASCGEFAAELRKALASAPADSARGNARSAQPSPVPARTSPPGRDVTVPAASTQPVLPALFPPDSAGRAKPARPRGRTVLLAGSAAVALAIGGTVTALLLPGATHGTPVPAPIISSGSAAGSASANGAGTALSGTMIAAGSSFQSNFQQAAITAFKSVRPGMTVNYDSVGSGTGRADLYSNTVLLAASDSPVPGSELSKVPAGKTVLYFPVVIGPISLAYNLPGVSALKLTASVLASIFQGNVKTWDDPSIKALNPGVSLPPTAITTTVRSDSAGVTQNFSLYLQDAASGRWKLGSASTVKWPSRARAVEGNSGVAEIIKTTPGAIGYLDYGVAQASGLSSALVLNKAGNYVPPSPPAATADAADAVIKPDLTFAAANAGSAPRPTRSPTSPGTWCTRSSRTPTTPPCSRPTLATCSGQASSC